VCHNFNKIVFTKHDDKAYNEDYFFGILPNYSEKLYQNVFLPNFNRIMQKLRKFVKMPIMHAKTQSHFSKVSLPIIFVRLTFLYQRSKNSGGRRY